ncbi:MAG: hypothetical protein ACR2RA_14200 [Geminicoccaceae bacterium]
MKTAGPPPVVRHAIGALIAAVFIVLLIAEPSAFDSGKGEIEIRLRDTPISVFTYRPSGCEPSTLLFVFHGLGRKASNMRDNAVELADRACLLILAPLFDKERFPNWRYHRAGVVRKGRVQPADRWTGPLVEALITWGRRWSGAPAMPYALFGHSAGGQFLSRLSAYSPPAGSERIVIANPSVHVLPSLEEPAPYGFGGAFSGEQAEGQLKAYLALPITIYLGDQDTGEKNLVRKAAARRQGANRLERGLYVFRLAWDLATQNGWPLNWRLVTASGIGHSSKDMLSAPAAEKALSRTESPWPWGLERQLDGEHAG